MPGSTARKPSKSGWVKVTPGVEMRALVEGEGTALVLYRIEPGLQFAPHSHRFPEYGTIVVGRGKLLLEKAPRDVREGDSYYIPSGLNHGFETYPGSPVVMLHVAVGLAAPLRVPMFRHLEGRTRALVRRIASANAEPVPELILDAPSPLAG
jgi:quercetin dioxygenase-like cupin family protein